MYGVLGKEVAYQEEYSPDLLFAIPREQARQHLNGSHRAIQDGYDVWNAYELSWLNKDGLPQVAVGRFTYAADSPNIIESKSFKLYLNSYNQSVFASWDLVSNKCSRICQRK